MMFNAVSFILAQEILSQAKRDTSGVKLEVNQRLEEVFKSVLYLLPHHITTHVLNLCFISILFIVF